MKCDQGYAKRTLDECDLSATGKAECTTVDWSKNSLTTLVPTTIHNPASSELISEALQESFIFIES